MNDDIALASAALKQLAANPQYAKHFREGRELCELLHVPASRYVVSQNAEDAIGRMKLLANKGYAIGLEYVGENVTDIVEVRRIASQYEHMIETLPHGGLGPRTELNFDLSNVGLLISRDLAAETTGAILAKAAEKHLFVTVSMERASMVDDILGVIFQLSPSFSNLGITLQAYLHHTPRDLEAVLDAGCKVRLVKGVYAESPEDALPRSAQLDERYLSLAARLADARAARSFATQDPALIRLLLDAGLLADGAELEMLHGVQPALLRGLREDGIQCRVYGTYGDNWYLHFLHRLAEAPENVLQALADFRDPSRVVFGGDY
ncbi:proline dehydrogenase [Burkholderia ubonensis]|uniref:proline dehydrogenase family protein n=1 Tax=Burkholderia ubonensis TaxID=101571 RepID=UPI000755C043|nr:proline dehydrogenase family protein [Burkholderia ubonensis]KVM47455.1 proline dehydrogenase [Burkholderia ubonensis]